MKTLKKINQIDLADGAGVEFELTGTNTKYSMVRRGQQVLFYIASQFPMKFTPEWKQPKTTTHYQPDLTLFTFGEEPVPEETK